MIQFKVLDKAISLKVKRIAALDDAIIVSLNKTAAAVLDTLKAEMPRVFDRPTQYTLNSLRVTKATKGNPSATIRPADFAGKGTPAENYLGPQIYGGARRAKRSENALRAFGMLSAGLYTAPGKGANLDAYGNQSVGEIRQILSYFQSAERTSGYTANMTAKTRARLARGTKKTGFGYSYFAIRTDRGNLAPGIYRRMNFAAGSAIKPVLMFVKKPQYRKRFRWFEVANTVARQMFDRYLEREVSRGNQ